MEVGRYNQISYLVVPEQLHNGDKPHKCLECGTSFISSSTFGCTRGEQPSKCLECGKSFSDNSYLHWHQKIHKGLFGDMVVSTCG
ncbi:hypothetical protein Nmel_016851 [Mimus melanotis]